MSWPSYPGQIIDPGFWPNQSGTTITIGNFMPQNYVITKAANGFIIKFSGTDYVFETIDSLLNYLRRELQPTETK